MALRIKVIKKRDYVYVIELGGSLDFDTYLELEEELKELLSGKIKAMILDMDDLDYISSAGIRAVMWAKKALTQKNTSFSMVNLQPHIEKVFAAMKILPMFDIFNDMPEADRYIDQIIKDEIEKQNI